MPSMGMPDDVMRRLESEAHDCYGWSNGPDARYAAHSHAYEKVLYCVSGSITFLLAADGTEVRIGPGERLVLAPGTVHSAVVGSTGVHCVEGRR